MYPRLYLSTDPDADIVRVARQLNASMPERLVAQAEGILGDLSGLRAVVLGAAYRGGVKETAFSGVFPTVKALKDRGAEVVVHDPLYSDEELRGLGFESVRIGGESTWRSCRRTTPTTRNSRRRSCRASSSSWTVVRRRTPRLGRNAAHRRRRGEHRGLS